VVITADPASACCSTLARMGADREKTQRPLRLQSPYPQPQQLLVGYAHDMDMDSAGRVLLPPMLRKFRRTG